MRAMGQSACETAESYRIGGYAMKRNRCRYCGVSDPAGLRFERSYLTESNYVCRSIDSCVERIKRFAKKKLEFAAGNGAQGDPATAGLKRMDLPLHATTRSISFTDKQIHDLLSLGL